MAMLGLWTCIHRQYTGKGRPWSATREPGSVVHTNLGISRSGNIMVLSGRLCVVGALPNTDSWHCRAFVAWYRASDCGCRQAVVNYRCRRVRRRLCNGLGGPVDEEPEYRLKF